ncbi:MAG: TIGR04076 family protein [Thermodesulfobacteriota bacterium]|nr:TIGR04076 family protein [Thermodesulfobacteriota bacterium]
MSVRVVVKKGKCQGNIHEVGQVFTVRNTTPAGMCLGAWNSIAPYVSTLLFGGKFPWEKERIKTTIHCPDPKGIVLELERLEEEDQETVSI